MYKKVVSGRDDLGDEFCQLCTKVMDLVKRESCCLERGGRKGVLKGVEMSFGLSQRRNQKVRNEILLP